MARKQVLIGLACLAAVAIAAAAYFIFGGRWKNESQTVERQGVTITAYDRTLGSPEAPIVMLEYAAPSCPICAGFDANAFPDIKRAYIDTGKVYYVFRVFPLGPADVAAEAMARCLPKDNYFSFIEILFRNQVTWDPEYNPPDVHGALVEMGRMVGMSPARVDNCIADKAAVQKIVQIGEDATKKYQVNATPTFVIDGKTHIGPFQDLKEFQTFIAATQTKK